MNCEPSGNSGYEHIVRIDNTWLAEGVNHIIANLYHLDELNSSVIVFDYHNYYSINLENLHGMICVMLCDRKYQKFLSDINKIHCCDANITPDSFKKLIKRLANGKCASDISEVSCCLNEREIAVIHSYMQGYSEAMVSDWFGVNIKTVYLARRRLFSKLECNSLLEFRMLCKTRVFTEWYSRQKEEFRSIGSRCHTAGYAFNILE